MRTPIVPAASLPSNSHTFRTSAVGTTEARIASRVMAPPDMALARFPAFHALPKMKRYGTKPMITMSDTRA